MAGGARGGGGGGGGGQVEGERRGGGSGELVRGREANAHSGLVELELQRAQCVRDLRRLLAPLVQLVPTEEHTHTPFIIASVCELTAACA